MALPRDAAIVILTGAGISAESGLRTFRDADGLWENHRVEEVATPEAFHRDPALVHRFYNERRQSLATVQPNAAHLALARLERAWAGPFLLVTQNVDDLHDRAGSRQLLHMHGELGRGRCLGCGAIHPWPGDMDQAIGTSGHVYPAAGLVQAAAPGARTVELNLQPSRVASAFQEARTGCATDLVPAFVEELLGG